MVNEYRSDVFTKELDLSFVAQIVANTYGIFLGASKKGPVEPRFLTSLDDFISVYGTPDASVGFMHYCAMSFFEKGGGGWFRRVVSSDATYGGRVIQNLGATGNRVLGTTALTSTAPLNEDITAIGGADDDDDNLFYLYAIGPGAYSKQIRIELTSANIDAPTINAVTSVEANAAADRTSALTAASYDWVVTAFNSYGETVASAVLTKVLTAAGKIMRLQWSAEAGASGYRIYRKLTSGSTYGLVATAGAGEVEYEDYGLAADTTKNPPATATVTDRPEFNISIFDESVSKTSPVEVFECSLAQRTNGFGIQTEIEEQINNNSNYVRVVSNADNLSAIPRIKTLAPFYLAEGTSGSVITESDMMLALEEFKDKEAYPASLIVNCGFTTVAYQKKMVEVAEYRQDCIALIDTPQNAQTSQAAINYRSVEVGINSNRAALFCNDHFIKDPYNDISLFVPTSGIAAALLAFTDRVANPAYSPAGYRRGISINTLKLRHRYTKTEMDRLAFANVNYFSTERAYGTVLKECYTMQADYSSFSYIPVRRIIDVAQQSTERALKVYLQEPNDDITEAQIVAMLRDFYNLMQNRRMIRRFEVYSRTSEAEVQLGNRLIYSIIEPVLPIVRIKHTTVLTKQGANFSEIIEQLT